MDVHVPWCVCLGSQGSRVGVLFITFYLSFLDKVSH